MNTRAYILFFTSVFLVSPLLLLTLIHVQFNLSIPLFDAFLYSFLTLVLLGIVFTMHTPPVCHSLSNREVMLSLLKAATVAIGGAIFIICLSQDVWGFPLYIPVLHWLCLAAFCLIAFSFHNFQNRSDLKNKGFQSSAEHENILVVGATGLAENYIRWIEDTAAEYITLAGVLEENMPENRKAFLSSSVIGKPVELTNILKQFKVDGTHINRLVIATKFQDLSSEAQGVLTYYESKGALLIDRMGDRVAGDDDLMQSPVTPYGSPIEKKSASKVLHFQNNKLMSDLNSASNCLFFNNRNLLVSGLV